MSFKIGPSELPKIDFIQNQVNGSNNAHNSNNINKDLDYSKATGGNRDEVFFSKSNKPVQNADNEQDEKQVKEQKKSESFAEFADRMNSTFPDRTFTIEDKERAIEAKNKIMSHPDCPSSSKQTIMEEIRTIQQEIEEIKEETNAMEEEIKMANNSTGNFNLNSEINTDILPFAGSM